MEVKDLMSAIKEKSIARVQVVINKLVGDGYSAAQLIEQVLPVLFILNISY